MDNLYDQYMFMRRPPYECYVDAMGNNLCKYECLSQDINQFRACIAEGYPFVFGFNIYGTFKNAGQMSDGVMPMPTYDEFWEEPTERHAVVAIGFNDASEVFTILNSWGHTWGHNGCFYMPYKFIKNSGMCSDFWKLTFSCQRGVPGPSGQNPLSYGGTVACRPQS